jgi:hypothetical protein
MEVGWENNSMHASEHQRVVKRSMLGEDAKPTLEKQRDE